MNDIWFTSDEHFGHANVIRFCKRPFKNVNEMRDELIRRHNEKVKPGDLVYHLGDMFWKSLSEQECLDIMSQLNGNHYYIWGNHDECIQNSPKLRGKFIWLKDIARVKRTDISPRIVLCHYAMLVWEGSHRGDWQLFGHSHGELSKGVPDAAVSKRLAQLDVGVDVWDYAPVSLSELAVAMKEKERMSGKTWHVCPGCGHKFFNYSVYDETCVQCMEMMSSRLELVEKEIRDDFDRQSREGRESREAATPDQPQEARESRTADIYLDGAGPEWVKLWRDADLIYSNPDAERIVNINSSAFGHPYMASEIQGS